MALTAAGILVETLHRWEVEVVFGMPGDGINGIMEALRQRQERIRFVQVRHEESAALMACGYAKYTGKLGVCLATSGPGGIHLLNGLYDAKLDGAPVLAITGLQFHDLIGTYTQQDVALDKLFMDVAFFNERIMGPTHVENVVELACRTALAYRCVSHIAFPVDIQDMEIDWTFGSKRNIAHHVSHVKAQSPRVPAMDELRRAADILNQGKKVAILAGQGAIGATDPLEQAAERLGAPIVKALLGKAAVPDDSAFTTGGIGLLGTAPSQDALEHCDTLLMVGTSFPYIEYLPEPEAAKAVQIDNNPIRIGLRYPVDVGLVGDSRATLERLLPMLESKENKRFLESAQRAMRDWKKTLGAHSAVMEKPMKPQVVAAELNKRLAADAIVSCDSGTVTTWWARYLSAQRGQKYSCSGTLATMACGLPYSIAAQIAYPGRQCISFMGDGAFTMLMGEFATCVKYALPVKVFVFKNNYLGQIQWEQMVFLGNPEYGCDLHPIDFAAFAQACGGTGIRIDDPKNCGELVERALQTPGPVLVEAVVDPFEPPMPAKVSISQTAKFAESLARGTPNRKKIALTVMSDKVREMV